METSFRGVVITYQMILDVLHEFSQAYPDTNEYEHWLDNRAYIYAIHYGEKLYPPKHILSQVSGIPTTEFNGGEQTNRVFRELGFEIKFK